MTPVSWCHEAPTIESINGRECTSICHTRSTGGMARTRARRNQRKTDSIPSWSSTSWLKFDFAKAVVNAANDSAVSTREIGDHCGGHSHVQTHAGRGRGHEKWKDLSARESPQPMWHAVFFEETRTVIYTRGFETRASRILSRFLDVPEGGFISAVIGSRSSVCLQTWSFWLLVGNNKLKNFCSSFPRLVQIRPQAIQSMSNWIYFGAILEGVCWCPHCHRPLMPMGEFMYGPPRLVDRIADQFRSVLTCMQEMNIKVRDTTVRLEKYGVDPWSISSDVLATLNPETCSFRGELDSRQTSTR